MRYALVSVAAVAVASHASAQQLNIFNWSDYIDEDLNPQFHCGNGH